MNFNTAHRRERSTCRSHIELVYEANIIDWNSCKKKNTRRRFARLNDIKSIMCSKYSSFIHAISSGRFVNSVASVFGVCQIVKTLLILVCIYIGSIYIREGNV